MLENFPCAVSNTGIWICFPHRFVEGRGNGAGWDFVLAMSMVDGVWVMEDVEGGLRGGDGGGGMEEIWRREAGG